MIVSRPSDVFIKIFFLHFGCTRWKSKDGYQEVLKWFSTGQTKEIRVNGPAEHVYDSLETIRRLWNVKPKPKAKNFLHFWWQKHHDRVKWQQETLWAKFQNGWSKPWEVIAYGTCTFLKKNWRHNFFAAKFWKFLAPKNLFCRSRVGFCNIS